MAESKKSATQFVITVDTETYAINGVPPQFGTNIYADLPEGCFGVSKIMEICRKHDVKATFFVDVYMHHHYGKERVRDLCRFIRNAGHDVQLHAHPSWLPDGVSGNLCDFSLKRQIEIVREGRDLIGEWVGQIPKCFRAGAYTANLDTITALQQNNFLVDSSYFAFHRNCSLSRQMGNRYTNRAFHIANLLEIPVTTYWLLRSWKYRKLSKLDVNACSNAEMNNIIPKLVSEGVEYIILFLHSFSFIRWKRDYSGVVPNYRAIDRFDSLLGSLTNGHYRAPFLTMGEIAARGIHRRQSEIDFVPTLNPMNIVARSMQRLTG